MLRVGREAIVTFPNFGHWSHRWQILKGRMPVSDKLPYQWYDTPNIHLCTVADFDAFLAERRYVVENRVVLAGGHEVSVLPNLRGRTRHLPVPATRCHARAEAERARGVARSHVTGARAAPRSAEGNLARGALQPAHADLRVHRLLLRPAALPAHQPAAGVAALRRGRPEGDRPVRADPASLHVEVPVVAADGPLRAAGARAPARLDARHASAAAGRDPRVRPAASASSTSGRSPTSRRRRVLLGQPGHRARRVPPRNPARRRNWASATPSTSTRTGFRASFPARWR